MHAHKIKMQKQVLFRKGAHPRNSSSYAQNSKKKKSYRPLFRAHGIPNPPVARSYAPLQSLCKHDHYEMKTLSI